MQIHKQNIFLIHKLSVVRFLLYTGILLAYWGSLQPWFIWPIVPYYAVIASFPIFLAFEVAASMEENIFSRTDFFMPTVAFVFMCTYTRVMNGSNINGYIEFMFLTVIYLALFRLDLQELDRLLTFLCKAMGILLAFSVPAFVLYLLGFPLTNSDITHGEGDLMYSYTNYYLFLIDDRFFFWFVPRFSSVFIEPGHLGTACAFLLFTQIGKWKKWYNILMFIATGFTFSLSAYVLLIITVIIRSWIRYKPIFLKLIASLLFFVAIGVGSMFYNDGQNMINLLIVERLEVEDGKLAGDNRVTDEFQAVYDDFVKTPDIIFGRDYETEDFGFGNAGYKVYLYDLGLVGLLFVIMFYFVTTMYSTNRRAIGAMFLIGTMAFYARATPIAFYFFIPLYGFAYRNKENLIEEDTAA